MLGKRLFVADQVLIVNLSLFFVSVDHLDGVTRESFPLDFAVSVTKFRKHCFLADDRFDSVTTRENCSDVFAGVEIAFEGL
jgi:hypothetical protein